MQSFTFEQLPQAIGQLHEKLERIEQLLSASAALAQPEPDTLLNIQQAADFLHLTVPTLYGKVHVREVPFSKQGKRLYFSKAELCNWVKSGRRKTQSELAQEAQDYLTRQKK